MRITTLLLLLIFFSIPRLAAQVPLNGLAAYYPFNGNANDLSGNGFNGTVVGPTIDTGYCREGYLFINDYIDCGNPAGNQFEMINDATVCMWMKIEVAPPAYYTLIGKDVSGGSVPKWFFATYPDSLAFHINGPAYGSGHWLYSNYFHFNVDSFYHVAVTKSGDSIQFYINAVPWGSGTLPVSALYVPADMHIGRNEQISTNEVLDEVYFYDRALSQQEIEEIYKACPNNPPSANFTASDTAICAGSCINFMNTSLNADSFLWYFPGAAVTASTDTNPASVCYNTAGQYNVQLISMSSGGSDTLLLNNYISVSASPAAGAIIIQPGSVCQGDSTILTAAGSTGNIQWQSSADSIHFTNITGADSSAYTTWVLQQNTGFRVVAGNNMCSDTSAPFTVFVNPVPTPPVLSVNDSLICPSDSAFIFTPGAYSSYRWNTGDTLPYTYAFAAGGYWLTVTDSAGCSAVSGHRQISVYPAASVSIIEQGDTLSSFGAVSYQWFFNDSVIPNAVNSLLVVKQSGYYAVQITDSNGCISISDNVAVLTEGIRGLGLGAGIELYPNPARGLIFISVLDGTPISEISIFNTLGQEVKKAAVPFNTGSRFGMDVSELCTGIYECMFFNRGQLVCCKKLIK